MDTRSDHSTRWLMLSIVFGSCLSTCLSPFVLTTILKDFHAGVFLMAFVPFSASLGGFFLFPIAFFFRDKNPKRQVIIFCMAQRFLMVVLPLSFLLSRIPPSAIPMIVVGIMALGSLITAGATGHSQTWFGAIIPGDVLATVLGTRTAIALLVAALLTPLIGWFIRFVHTTGGDVRLFYGVLLSVAFAFGVTDILLLSRVRGGVAPKPSASGRIGDSLRMLLRDRRIREVCRISFLQLCGIFLAAPFFLLAYYACGFNEFATGIIVTAGSLGAALGSVMGGFIADNVPVRRVLFAGMLSLTGLQFLFLLALIVFARSSGSFTGFAVFLLLSFLYNLSIFVVASAMTKLTYQNVASEANVSFSFIQWITGVMTLLLMAASAKFGAFLAGRESAIRELFGPDATYFHVLFALSVLAGVIAIFFLRRQTLQKGSDGNSEGNSPGSGGGFLLSR